MELGRPSEQDADNRRRVAELKAEGLSLRAIAERMNEEGRRTARASSLGWRQCSGTWGRVA